MMKLDCRLETDDAIDLVSRLVALVAAGAYAQDERRRRKDEHNDGSKGRDRPIEHPQQAQTNGQERNEDTQASIHLPPLHAKLNSISPR